MSEMTRMSEMTPLTDASTLALGPLTVPATIDAPDAAEFRAYVELSNRVCAHDAGHDGLAWTAEEALPPWHDQVDHTMIGVAARYAGELVGAASIEAQTEEGAANVEFDLVVDPHRWGSGIEEALLTAVEDTARSLGRPVVQTFTLHRATPDGPRLAPPTGYGTIPADDRQTRFFQENGYSLEQVERTSDFDLTADLGPVERMLADAASFAGPDYRVVSWTSPTPDAYKEGFANAVSRMSTDVPTGDMVWTPEVWDAERVERRDARLAAGGLTVSVACAVHVPTGAIAAYNELTIAGDRRGVTHQWGTLVLREHRGHRLGMIVKCANLLRWREVAPLSPRVTTFNAEENRPMLDINEAIGFVPVSYAAGWKKVLG
jgi:GNAT superfamily N-acetyltransferase